MGDAGDARDVGGEFLPGDPGYWQHWWNALNDRDPAVAATGAPFRMELIADRTFAERDWLAEFDREIVAHVVGGGLVTGRVIVPEESIETPAEDLIAIGLTLGFEVRALTGPEPFAIYDGVTAVLPERDDAGEAGHRVIRRASVVGALQSLFDLHWAAAIPWDEHKKGTAGVLQLLARGWDDARIAASLGISPRTVSRRVAEAMNAVGARSRFELGMRYGLSRRG